VIFEERIEGDDRIHAGAPDPGSQGCLAAVGVNRLRGVGPAPR
jgi:hypothetical protein